MQFTAHGYAWPSAQRRENNTSMVTSAKGISLLYVYISIFYFSPVHPRRFAEVVELVKNKTITHAASQNLLSILYRGDKRKPKQVGFHITLVLTLKTILILSFHCSKVVEEEGWAMINDSKKLEAICQQILSSNPKAVKFQN